VLALPLVGSLPDQPPEPVQLLALVEDQLSVDAEPLLTVPGLAFSFTMGLDATLTPAEAALRAPLVAVAPEPAPTWPQPPRAVVTSTQRITQSARPRRGLAPFIDTTCFKRSPFAGARNSGGGRRKTENAEDSEPARGKAPAGNPAISAHRLRPEALRPRLTADLPHRLRIIPTQAPKTTP